MADTSSITSWITSNVDVIANISKSMVPVQKLLSGFAYVLGLLFAIKALLTLKQFGESKSSMSSSGNLKEPLIYMIVAAIMIYLPSATKTLMATTFGSSSILQYQPIDSKSGLINSMFSNSVFGQSLVIIIQTIGLIAFIRGWILIARAAGQGQQPGSMGKGMMHVFGGILAMNIVLTIEIVNNTLFGTT